MPSVPRRRRARAWLFASLLSAVACVHAQPEIHALTGIIEGHQVGGVAVDLVGDLYVADFGDIVWKITPEGRREVLASGLYGSSGNAIDREGNLLQSNFYGNSIVKIDRNGRTSALANGLSGPVGIALEKKTGDAYVANCAGNSVAKITPDGAVSPFAKSDLFKCPNGVAFDADGNLYVANFRSNRLLKVDPKGAVAPFATVAREGLGHLCFSRDRFYVTAYHTHELYEVTLKGDVKRLLGNGERGIVDGGPDTARLSFPNGIACDPFVPRLYINEYVAESTSSLPRRAIVREVVLDAGK